MCESVDDDQWTTVGSNKHKLKWFQKFCRWKVFSRHQPVRLCLRIPQLGAYVLILIFFWHNVPTLGDWQSFQNSKRKTLIKRAVCSPFQFTATGWTPSNAFSFRRRRTKKRPRKNQTEKFKIPSESHPMNVVVTTKKIRYLASRRGRCRSIDPEKWRPLRTYIHRHQAVVKTFRQQRWKNGRTNKPASHPTYLSDNNGPGLTLGQKCVLCSKETSYGGEVTTRSMFGKKFFL